MEWLIDNVCGAIISFLVGAIMARIVSIRKNIRVCVHTMFRRNKDYRISAAYLFKINIDNKYLLIRGNRIEQYQPVGGVYKYYNSFKNKFNEMELRDENNRDFYENGDLRIYVKGKYLQKFLGWFESGKNRECTVEREFREELVKKGVLKENIFEEVEFEFVRRFNNGIKYSPHFKCYEVLIFDIFNVNFKSEDAIQQINEYVSQNDDLVLVSFDEIERECVTINGKSVKIGAHTKEVR